MVLLSPSNSSSNSSPLPLNSFFFFFFFDQIKPFFFSYRYLASLSFSRLAGCIYWTLTRWFLPISSHFLFFYLNIITESLIYLFGKYLKIWFLRACLPRLRLTFYWHFMTLPGKARLKPPRVRFTLLEKNKNDGAINPGLSNSIPYLKMRTLI